jgi:subtilisin family serine protease
MRPYSLTLLLALAFSACASAGPAPAPRPTPVEPPPTVQPPPTTAAIATVPDRWWLLDPDQDGVYGAGVDRAYREVLAARTPGRTVVVAIIDSGVDAAHEDLHANVWRNPREQRSGRDDDGDGLVDDTIGWNWIGGRDGRHVDQDTYEITRLYAACRTLAATGTAGAARPAERVTQQLCTTIEADYAAKRTETQQMLAQVTEIRQVVDFVVNILRAQLRTDTLTLEAVRALTPLRNDVREARQLYLQMHEQGITPQMVQDEVERLEKLSEYGLNPDFDPRDIVGDNYADPRERVYGNADVGGPDPSHGTGVAGIVAAVRGNDTGIDGIASPVQIMVLRAVPQGDERDKDIANAIRYAVDHGAHIINMSFGKAYSPEKEVVDEAVRYADQRGVLMVHAAGNDAKDLATEGNFPNRTYLSGGAAVNWIEVGASDWRGAENLAAEFSNYGAQQVDVFAPGSQILSTAPGNTYEEASGTSFAAPVVSGIAALLMSYYPNLTAMQVKRIIEESATPLRERMVVRPGGEDLVRFGDLSITGGIVNAYAAVRMAEQMSGANR